MALLSSGSAVKLGSDIHSGQPVTLEQAQRLGGMSFIGLSGFGKTTGLINWLLQDVEKGIGVCFFDVHGDAIKDILARLPSGREKDVILLDLLDIDHPFGFNMYECPNPTDPRQRSLTVNYLRDVIAKYFIKEGDLSATPLIAQMLRNTTITMIDNPGMTLAELPLLLKHEDARARLTQQVKNSIVKLFWEEYERMKPTDRQGLYASTLNKVEEFLTDDIALNIFGQSKTTINFREIMDSKPGKILLIRLDRNLQQLTSLVGSVIISQIAKAAFSREDIPYADRVQFNLYADEYERFQTPTFADLIAEVRKYKVAPLIAFQWLSQLDVDNKNAAKSAKNIIVSRVNKDDAQEFAPGFAKTPQAAWEEEIEKEWVEVLEEEWEEEIEKEWHERVEEVVDDGVEEIKTVHADPIGWFKQGHTHDNPRVMQLVEKYIRPLLEKSLELSGSRAVSTHDITQLLQTINAFLTHAMKGVTHISLNPVKTLEAVEIGLEYTRVNVLLHYLKKTPKKLPEVSDGIREVQEKVSILCDIVLDINDSKWDYYVSMLPPGMSSKMYYDDKENKIKYRYSYADYSMEGVIVGGIIDRVLMILKNADAENLRRDFYPLFSSDAHDISLAEKRLLAYEQKMLAREQDPYTSDPIYKINRQNAALIRKELKNMLQSQIVSWFCKKLEALRIPLVQKWQEREKKVNDVREAYEKQGQDLQVKLQELQEKLQQLDTHRVMPGVPQSQEMEQKQRLLTLLMTRFGHNHSYTALGSVWNWSSSWVNGFSPSNGDYYDIELLETFIEAYQGNGVFSPAAITTLREVSIYGCSYKTKRFGLDSLVFRTGYLSHIFNKSFPGTQEEKQAMDDFNAYYENYREKIEKEYKEIAEEKEAWKRAQEEDRNNFLAGRSSMLPPVYKYSYDYLFPSRASRTADEVGSKRRDIIEKLYYDHYQTSTDPIWQKRRTEAKTLADQDVQAVMRFISEWDELAQLLHADPIQQSSGLSQPRKRTQVHYLTHPRKTLTHPRQTLTHPRKTIMHPQRTEQDMRGEMERELLELEPFVAYCKLISGKYTIRIDDKKAPDAQSVVQARTQRIIEQTRQNYCTKRKDVEAEIAARQEELTKPLKKQPKVKIE